MTPGPRVNASLLPARRQSGRSFPSPGRGGPLVNPVERGEIARESGTFTWYTNLFELKHQKR